MYNNRKIAVIIPAAGKSTRMKSNQNKQYMLLQGIPVVARTIEMFEKNPYIDEIVPVVNPDDVEYFKKNIIEEYNFSKIKNLALGGKERQESCRNGLMSVSQDVDYVLFHDGARPFVTTNIIDKTIMALINEGFDACCTAVPVKDTVKVANIEMNIMDTPDRKTLYGAQTPQGFKFKLIKGLYDRACNEDVNATDDSQIAEHYGVDSHIVIGSYDNIKITTKEDLYIAEIILKARG